MNKDSIFNILGPVMIGPSSSHTAGAERIGRAGRVVLGKPVAKARFRLHGSFAATYKGHGTDRALVAGILGFQPDDERIRDSFELAKKKAIDFTFEPADLGDVHPNTVEITVEAHDGTRAVVTGTSVGGGSIRIVAVDGEPVDFDGSLPVLLIKHKDQQGMISRITFNIALQGINIANLKVTRQGKGASVATIIETDTVIPQLAVQEISTLAGVLSVRAIESI